MTSILDNLLESLRRAIVILAIDNCELRKKLIHGYKTNDPPSCTSDRVILAAHVLGLVERNEDFFVWKSSYIPFVSDNYEWQKIIDVIKQQETYLNLASVVKSSTIKEKTTPKQQLSVNPEEYFTFLNGVEASHLHHAKWFATIEALKHAKHLIDLGGGLGTFSRAWINTAQGRKATLVDFPAIKKLLLMKKRLSSRLVFCGMDLSKCSRFEFQGDVYLLANVLHLLQNWREVLFHVISQIRSNSLLSIMEAIPFDKAGILFDLQVHLRSGGLGGLILPAEIESALISANLSIIKRIENKEPVDPFQRKYLLWICRK